MKTNEEKIKIIEALLKKEILAGTDLFSDSQTSDLDFQKCLKKTQSISGHNSFAVINKDFLNLLLEGVFENDGLKINWAELEKIKANDEKQGTNSTYKEALKGIIKKIEHSKTAGSSSLASDLQKNGVKILFNYNKAGKKKDIQDFVKYFNLRYKALETILISRQELSSPASIARLLSKKEKENVSAIGIVKEKTSTSNNNIILTIEDPTGEIKVLVSKSKPDLLEQAKDIVLDEVIGVTGVCGNEIIFCSRIIHPDIPAHKELKKSSDEIYALFLSDLHFGSDTFLADDFQRFIKWIRGELGSPEQRERVKKVKYIFIVGDLVDGVGIYPGQESELLIKDIYGQYKHCAELLSKIPSRIQIIVCAGNHDGSRLSEPQPPLSRDFISPLLELPNLTVLSNPSMVNIGATEEFPGFDVLLYHGYSFDYYIANVDSIRNSGGYDRADLIMKFLLQRRHLAPSHSSTLYEPDTEEDPLVITRVPDFFVSGHIHKVAVSNYRGVSLICGSCWQSVTSFQEKMGHHPEPARVPMVNLQTRETKILRF